MLWKLDSTVLPPPETVRSPHHWELGSCSIPLVNLSPSMCANSPTSMGGLSFEGEDSVADIWYTYLGRVLPGFGHLAGLP